MSENVHTDMCALHISSLIGIFTGRILEANGIEFLHVDNEDSDQTARMRRLI